MTLVKMVLTTVRLCIPVSSMMKRQRYIVILKMVFFPVVGSRLVRIGIISVLLRWLRRLVRERWEMLFMNLKIMVN